MKSLLILLVLSAASISQAKVARRASHPVRSVQPCPNSGYNSYNGRILNGVVIEVQDGSPGECPVDHPSLPAPSYNGRILNGVVVEEHTSSGKVRKSAGPAASHNKRLVSRHAVRVAQPCPNSSGPNSYNGRLINGVVSEAPDDFPGECPIYKPSSPAPSYHGRLINGVVGYGN